MNCSSSNESQDFSEVIWYFIIGWKMRNFGSILLGFWISSLNFALAETESALFSEQVVESCWAVAELWTVDSAPARKQKKIRGMAIGDFFQTQKFNQCSMYVRIYSWLLHRGEATAKRSRNMYVSMKIYWAIHNMTSLRWFCKRVLRSPPLSTACRMKVVRMLIRF